MAKKKNNAVAKQLMIEGMQRALAFEVDPIKKAGIQGRIDALINHTPRGGQSRALVFQALNDAIDQANEEAFFDNWANENCPSDNT